MLLCSVSGHAQHTKYDFSASFAYGGQYPFITSGTVKFYTTPFIWNIRCQLGTTYVQSISVVLEHVAETRSRKGIWYPNGYLAPVNTAYDANISESLRMTSLYFEMARTIVRTDIFRIALGADLGYGLGSTSTDVERLSDHSTSHVDGNAVWTSFFLGAFIRARLTIVDNEQVDVGLTLTGRYWGLPTLGPLSTSTDVYDGPDVRSLHEVGYLAGISVGLKK